MDIKDRLLAFVNALGIKRSEFAKEINVTQSNVSDWMNRKKPSKPSPPAMARINERFGLNLNWLMTGKGDMLMPDPDRKLYGDGADKNLQEMSGSKSVYRHKVNPFESRNVTFPIFGEIAAGPPIRNENDEPVNYVEIPKTYLYDKENTYLAIRINGDSMAPQVLHGDVIVIHERNDIENLNGKICACRTHEGITLKKVQFDQSKNRVILRPLNPQFEVIIIEDFELETFRIFGEMALQFRVFK